MFLPLIRPLPVIGSGVAERYWQKQWMEQPRAFLPHADR